jgi:hypothetical protein
MATPGQAAVQSVDAIAAFRLASLTFAAEIQAALSEAEADLGRLPQWLKLDRVPHWTNQIKIRHQAVQDAKRELARKQLMTSPEPHSCIDERKALQRAKEAFELAESKLAATRRWIMVWEEKSSQLRAGLTQLRDLADRDLIAAAARLARQVEALDAYLAAASGNLGPDGLPVGSTSRSAGGSVSRVATEGSPDRISAYAGLRRLAPVPPVRAATPTGDENQLVRQPGPMLSTDDIEHLERLALEGLAPRSPDKVLLEAGALASSVLCMIRTDPADGDSGWYLAGAGAAGMQPQPPVAVSIQTILELRPDLTVPLLLPVGIMLVASAGRIASLCQASNQELWS